jgi:hypothetical protein
MDIIFRVFMVVSFTFNNWFAKQTYALASQYFMVMIEAGILMSKRQFEMSKQMSLSLWHFSKYTVGENF